MSEKRSLPRRLWIYWRGYVGLKRDDVILASFPRSGSTWLRFLFTNLISLREGEGREVDFVAVDRTMPELGVDDLTRPWAHDCLPRIVKTHNPFWFAFRGRRSLLLHRDPRAVMASFYRFRRGHRRVPFRGTFAEFLRDSRLGLPAWFRHRASWEGRATWTLSYEEMREDGLPAFRGLLDRLGVEMEEEVVEKAWQRSALSRVRKVEERQGHPKAERFEEGATFAGGGTETGWKELFSPEDLAYYADLRERFGVGPP